MRLANRSRLLALFAAGLSLAFADAACSDDESAAPTGTADAGDGASSTDAGEADGTISTDASGGDTSTTDANTTDAEPDSGVDAAPCVVDAGGSAFLEDAIEIAVGAGVGCAIRQDHSLVCWGTNVTGQLGVPSGTLTDSAQPKVLTLPADAGSASVAHVVIGNGFTCVLDSTGTVWCLGTNGQGELGRGAIGGVGTENLQPVTDGQGGVLKATAITAGRHHACAIRTAGDLVCWGTNGSGELNVDGSAPVPQPVPVGVTVSGSNLRVNSEAHAHHTCALTATSSSCWGANDLGAVALPVSARAVNPDVGAALSDGGATPPASDIAVGGDHSCALDMNGALYCWGYGAFGAIGGGDAGPHPTPQVVPFDGGTIRELVAGSEQTCFSTTAGNAYCMGYNGFGELGNGVYDSGATPIRTPQRVVGYDGGGALDGVLSIAAGGVACVITQGACGAALPGPVSCWGFNLSGDLGNDAGASLIHPVPIRVLAP